MSRPSASAKTTLVLASMCVAAVLGASGCMEAATDDSHAKNELCPDEMVARDSGEACCWPDQMYVESAGECRGVPDCPAGYVQLRGACHRADELAAEHEEPCEGNGEGCLEYVLGTVASADSDLEEKDARLLRETCRRGNVVACLPLTVGLGGSGDEKSFESRQNRWQSIHHLFAVCHESAWVRGSCDSVRLTNGTSEQPEVNLGEVAKRACENGSSRGCLMAALDSYCPQLGPYETSARCPDPQRARETFRAYARRACVAGSGGVCRLHLREGHSWRYTEIDSEVLEVFTERCRNQYEPACRGLLENPSARDHLPDRELRQLAEQFCREGDSFACEKKAEFAKNSDAPVEE